MSFFVFLVERSEIFVLGCKSKHALRVQKNKNTNSVKRTCTDSQNLSFIRIRIYQNLPFIRIRNIKNLSFIRIKKKITIFAPERANILVHIYICT